MDAYLLIRFLKLVSMICFVGACITFPILFPINATGGGNNVQLNILSMSNVEESKYERYFAHAFVAWLYLGKFLVNLSTYPWSFWSYISLALSRFYHVYCYT